MTKIAEALPEFAFCWFDSRNHCRALGKSGSIYHRRRPRSKQTIPQRQNSVLFFSPMAVPLAQRLCLLNTRRRFRLVQYANPVRQFLCLDPIIGLTIIKDPVAGQATNKGDHHETSILDCRSRTFCTDRLRWRHRVCQLGEFNKLEFFVQQ